ncbi:MAG: glycosyltransferase [Candidatus Promineifilaceae bacterium]
MKIIHVIETFAPLGGAELYTINQVDLLVKAGIENAVIYWNEHPQTFQVEYPVFHISEKGQARVSRLETIINAIQPNIIYLHTVRDPIILSAAARYGTAVAYMHDFYPVCPGLAKFYRRGQAICTRPYGLACVPMIYLRRCASARHPLSVYRIMQTPPRYLAAFEQMKVILVASTYMKELLVQNGIGAERISILPYFVHMPGGTTPIPTGEASPKLLFVGRLENEKGLPFLLKALARVSHPYQLLIAGQGSREEAYKALAQKLGVADQVKFLGWVSTEEMKKLYEEVLCLVFPSIWPEPFGMVGIEAFYNSRPVIGFNVGGVSDWLHDGWNGYLVPSQDIDQLANRIERLLEKPDLASQMGKNGYSFANVRYRAEQHLEQLLTIFDSLPE